jgi:hypothetical protein
VKEKPLPTSILQWQRTSAVSECSWLLTRPDFKRLLHMQFDSRNCTLCYAFTAWSDGAQKN